MKRGYVARENDRASSGSGRSHPALSGDKAYEALTATVKALDEMAPWRPLSPDAEWAQHNCRVLVTEMDGNPGGFIGGEITAQKDYSWIAKWTRDPTPTGLDGGRLQYFELYRYETPVAANDYKDPLPNTLLARYLNGKLTRFGDDPRTDTLLRQIKQPPPADKLRWEESRSRSDSVRPEDGVHHNLRRAARALDELAVERPLSPAAEKARDLCHAALETIDRYGRSLDEAVRKAARRGAGRRHDRDDDRDR